MNKAIYYRLKFKFKLKNDIQTLYGSNPLLFVFHKTSDRPMHSWQHTHRNKIPINICRGLHTDLFSDQKLSGLLDIHLCLKVRYSIAVWMYKMQSLRKLRVYC